jgi:hypothetical protein
VEVRNRARTAQKLLTTAEIEEDEAYAREAAGIAEVEEMEAAEAAEAATASSQSIPSTLDLESLGVFDPSALTALPEEWLAAGAIPAEFEAFADGFVLSESPPVEVGNSSGS